MPTPDDDPFGPPPDPGDPAAPAARQLDFEMQPQAESMQNWCWAAVAVSVARYYGLRQTPPQPAPWSQCSLVSAVLGVECCTGGPDPACDIERTLDEGLEQVGCFGSHSDGPSTLVNIQTDIDHDWPVAVHLRWDDGTGHFIVISGYERGPEGEFVIVQDPLFDPAPNRFPLAEVQNAYRGQGVWTQTVWTRPPDQ